MLTKLTVEPWSSAKNKWAQAAIDAAALADPKALSMALRIALNFNALDERSWGGVLGGCAHQASPECLEAGLVRWREAGRPKVLWGMVSNLAVRSKEVSMLEALRKHGAPIDLDAALEWTVVRNFPEGVDALLRMGASAEGAAGASSSLLSRAAARDLEEIVSLLVRAGASLDRQDERGWTALMFAADGGCRGCLDLLIAAGADLTMRSGVGRSAVRLARDAGHGECERMLGERLAALEASEIVSAVVGSREEPLHEKTPRI